MVLQKLVEYTSFLHYDASPVERLHVVQQNIVTQPTCKACNGIVKMRTSGRYRATFPTYCSARCLSNQETVKEKRKATNLQRYGNPFAIASTVCREKAKQKWLENYGVDNPAKADVVKQKRKQMLLDR